VRQSFGNDFLIGVSTHSLDEARTAHDANADFAVFGPVFETPAKARYGQPVGLEQLKHVCSELKPFPILAIGGVTEDNFTDCLRAGAQGIAAIRMFDDPKRLRTIVARIHENSH
jgi:thiamine-phosphate pyrophosphorylase